MLNVWPPPQPAVVRRLSDAGLYARLIEHHADGRALYEVLDGDGRVVHIRVRGDGPRDLVDRVWRALETISV